MFQTPGNLATDPHAGLLFIDFENGNVLQLAGRARIIWKEEYAEQFTGAERLVEFAIDAGWETPAGCPLRGQFIDYSPFNPG